jgi:hypothetical protein
MSEPQVVTPPVTPGPVFDYTKYQTPGITVAQLDMLASSVFGASSVAGYAGMIWGGVKLIVALAYIWARDKLVSQQEELALQQYQVAQTDSNQNEVNHQ